jgi:hypothetical protein
MLPAEVCIVKEIAAEHFENIASIAPLWTFARDGPARHLFNTIHL